jgi:hypothetical protein
MGKFTPTKKQEEAFNEVVKAFKKARKTGLVFYGKCGTLVAYKRNADNYIESDFELSLRGGGGQIENLSSLGCISDSGADDYGCYLTQGDEDLYS